MNKILPLLVLMSTCLSAFAQEKGNAKIYGSVIDTETNQPVEFANVALIDPTTQKPIDGAVCDDKGKFEILKVPTGTYSVSISFIGYETQTVDKITVEEKRDDVNLGTIKLGSGTKVLSEVVVEGQKQLIEERVDRTIYNAENDITSKGGDATDVLKKVPMLSVDLEGNVTLRGSQNIRVLINNKPSTIMASSIADALKQIPADQIKTVEVITSPSAKYDAEGTGGIINIITKKNNLQGATLNIDAGVGLRGSNLGLNGNYRTKKMGFSLGGFGRYMYNTTGSFDNSQLTRDTVTGAETLNLQRADTHNKGLFGNYTLGWDYDIDQKNSLAASVRFGARNFKNYQDNFLTEVYANDYSYYLQNVVTNDASNTIDLNLTYTRLYDKPQRELSILALYSNNDRNNDFERRTLEALNINQPAGFKNLNDSYNREITLQLDYQTPIGANQIFEIGGKDIIRKVFSDFTGLIDSGDGIYLPTGDSQLSNNLNYDQNVMAGYLAYTLNLQKGYSIKAGSRYEYTTIEAFTQTEENIEIPSYGVFVPSVNLSKKLTSGAILKAAYNRRIQRPSIQFLNPNLQNSNQLNASVGNPRLNPEYTNNYELSYNTFIKGTSLNFTTFYRNTTGSIQRIRTTIPGEDGGPERILTEFANIGTEDAYGLSVFANVNIGKLSLNGGSDIYYNILDNNLGTQNEGWVVSGRIFGNYNLGKGWGIQAFGFMRGRQVQLQGSQGGFGFYNLGVRKDLMEKRGSIGLALENFLSSSFKIRNDLYSPTIDQKSLTVINNLSFRVTFSYRLGKMSMDAPRPRRTKSINNDDLKDGGDGGGGVEGGGGGPQQRGGGGFGGGQGNGGGRPQAATPVKVPAGDPAAVVNAEGSWDYTIESPQGGEGTLVLKKEGETYNGSITNKRFNSNTTLSSVTLNGNELTLAYEVSGPGGNKMPVQVKAIISGETLNGSMTVGQFGTFPMKATRAK